MKGKGEYFGTHRVIEPQGLLPQAASKVDNTPEIWSNEILIDVIALQPTARYLTSILIKNRFPARQTPCSSSPASIPRSPMIWDRNFHWPSWT